MFQNVWQDCNKNLQGTNALAYISLTVSDELKQSCLNVVFQTNRGLSDRSVEGGRRNGRRRCSVHAAVAEEHCHSRFAASSGRTAERSLAGRTAERRPGLDDIKLLLFLRH